uniref:dihydroxyacetone phosphate acyltransferase-like n=1 Tax=Monopterus albus TaxID=43700 RepID=UPI0009B39BAB|nr:dihydroxyacetone phosphate acyltransferase-like [Monopterus albus]
MSGQPHTQRSSSDAQCRGPSLCEEPIAVLREEGLPWHQLTEKTLWLRNLALDFGAHLNWPGHVADSVVMSSTVALHHSIVHRKAGCLYVVQEEEPERNHLVGPEQGVFRTAVAALMLACYKNQSLHVFVRPALLASAIHITKSTRKDQLYTFFCFLQDIFAYEFIFIPGKSSQDFEEACVLLKKCGAAHFNEQELTVSEAGLEVLSFLQALLQPFIDSYRMIFRYLSEEGAHVFTEKQFLPAVRNLAAKLILSGELHTYEALSSEIQKNVLSALRRLKALTKLNESEQKEYRVNKSAVRSIGDTLSGKIPPQMLQTTAGAKP